MDTGSAFPHDTDTTSEPNGFSIITPSTATVNSDASVQNEALSSKNCSLTPADEIKTSNNHSNSAVKKTLVHSEAGLDQEISSRASPIVGKDAPLRQSPEEKTHPEASQLGAVLLSFTKPLDDSSMGDVMDAITRVVGPNNEVDFQFFPIATTEALPMCKNDSHEHDSGFPVATADTQPKEAPLIDPFADIDFTQLADLHGDALPLPKRKKDTSASIRDDLTRARVLNVLGLCRRNIHPCVCPEKAPVESGRTTPSIMDEEVLSVSDLVDLAQARTQHMLIGCNYSPAETQPRESKRKYGDRSVRRAALFVLSALIFMMCISLLFNFYRAMKEKRGSNSMLRRYIGI